MRRWSPQLGAVRRESPRSCWTLRAMATWREVCRSPVSPASARSTARACGCSTLLGTWTLESLVPVGPTHLPRCLVPARSRTRGGIVSLPHHLHSHPPPSLSIPHHLPHLAVLLRLQSASASVTFSCPLSLFFAPSNAPSPSRCRASPPQSSSSSVAPAPSERLSYPPSPPVLAASASLPDTRHWRGCGPAPQSRLPHVELRTVDHSRTPTSAPPSSTSPASCASTRCPLTPPTPTPPAGCGCLAGWSSSSTCRHGLRGPRHADV